MIVKRPSHPHRPSPARLPRVAFAALLGAILVCPTAAFAAGDDDEERPWYVEFQAGVTHAPNQTIRDGSGNQGRVSPHTDPGQIGYNVGAALGRSLLDFLRVELAVAYRENGVDEVSFGAPGQNADGEISLFTLMANGYVELTPELIGTDLFVVPYLGAGIGYGELDVDVRLKAPNVLDIRGQENVFAYNFMAGLRVPFTKVSSLSATYRYVATTDAEGTRARIATVAQDIEAEYDAHEVYLGLRFEF